MSKIIKKILVEHKLKTVMPNIKGEMEEIERAAQDLNRYHQFNVSVRDIIDSFGEAQATPLYPEIWDKLQNTESNQIEKGDFKSVFRIADLYL